jgi:glutaredoxin
MVKYTTALQRWTYGVADAIVVFHKQRCPYCIAAIDKLQNLGRPLVLVDVETDAKYRACKAKMQTVTGHSTYPRIFEAGNFVGGSDALPF